MPSILSKAIRYRRYLRILALVKDPAWAKLFLDMQSWPTGVHVDKSTGLMVVDDLNLKVDKSQSFILQDLVLLRQLATDVGVQFSRNDSGAIEAQYGITKLALETAEEVSILGHILADKCYDFDTAKPVVVVDIGMNVGISALYFASMPNVSAVYGFEPFPATFASAVRNFALNSTADKITPYMYGLSDADTKLNATYSTEFKASARTTGVAKFLTENGAAQAGQMQSVEVVLKDAGEALKHVVEKHPDCFILVKMDCEGGEHKIVPALAKAGVLRSLDLIMLEWHEPGPTEIRRLLNDEGFVTLAHGRDEVVGGEHMGFMYAFRGDTTQSLDSQRREQ